MKALFGKFCCSSVQPSKENDVKIVQIMRNMSHLKADIQPMQSRAAPKLADNLTDAGILGQVNAPQPSDSVEDIQKFPSPTSSKESVLTRLSSRKSALLTSNCVSQTMTTTSIRTARSESMTGLPVTQADDFCVAVRSNSVLARQGSKARGAASNEVLNSRTNSVASHQANENAGPETQATLKLLQPVWRKDSHGQRSTATLKPAAGLGPLKNPPITLPRFLSKLMTNQVRVDCRKLEPIEQTAACRLPPVEREEVLRMEQTAVSHQQRSDEILLHTGNCKNIDNVFPSAKVIQVKSGTSTEQRVTYGIGCGDATWQVPEVAKDHSDLEELDTLLKQMDDDLMGSMKTKSRYATHGSEKASTKKNLTYNLSPSVDTRERQEATAKSMTGFSIYNDDDVELMESIESEFLNTS